MSNGNFLTDFFNSFTKTVHTPFGKDIIVTGKGIIIAGAAVLAIVLMIIVICIARKARRKKEESSNPTVVYSDTAYIPPVEEDFILPPQTEDSSEEQNPDVENQTEEVPEQQEATPEEEQSGGETPEETDSASEFAEPKMPEPPTISLIGKGGLYNNKRVTQQGDVIIGRHPTRCTLLYPEDEKGISAVHCRIQKKDDKVLLTDLGSSCGTFVNGEKLRPNEPFSLQAGDTFWLADSINSFYLA